MKYLIVWSCRVETNGDAVSITSGAIQVESDKGPEELREEFSKGLMGDSSFTITKVQVITL